MAAFVSLETRKPATTLCLSDLSAYPVWEFADDEEGVEGRDESWVRPVDVRVVPRRSYVLVSAAFKDRRGRDFNGYVVVSTLHGTLDIRSGTIIEGGEPLDVPNREQSSYREDRAALMHRLGLMEAELSPITFTVKVPIEGIPVSFEGELRLPTPPEFREQQLRFW